MRLSKYYPQVGDSLNYAGQKYYTKTKVTRAQGLYPPPLVKHVI